MRPTTWVIGTWPIAMPWSTAAKKAYSMAGIKDPLKQIDVAEISEEYSYQELLWMEGLGFCEPGEAGKLIDCGVTKMGGKLPVNPSGGMLSGNPNIVAGMARVAEAVLQLRGEAGERQVAGSQDSPGPWFHRHLRSTAGRHDSGQRLSWR